MHKQKIILITNEYPPKRGGAGVYCEEIVYSSQKLGIPLHVWAPNYVKENQKNLKKLLYQRFPRMAMQFSNILRIMETKKNIQSINYFTLRRTGKPKSIN